MFEWHQHDCYELILTLGANGKRFLADDVHAFESIDLALILPTEPHTWDNTEQQAPVGDVVVVLWPKSLFAVDISELEAIQAWLNGLEQGCVFSKDIALKVKEYMFEMNTASALKRLTLLSEVLFILMQAKVMQSASVNASARNVARMSPILELLKSRIACLPSLPELAGEVNLSVATLKRLFKSSLGTSYTQYCLTLRLKRAKHLLATTALPIGVIADRCGFNSSAYFNQCYKKHEGMTPNAFRKQFAWRKRISRR
ncbi:AraC family transcriptional regulator [Pseudoalteromonas luteoviolacea]|uniref:HTH araC/xylS-type domain-containing protein n=1 Tax=Pseudoalteromonas luteoviolacea H33 TaxID=1365251 RepID=A0A167FRG5_9GAMM|nr:AraC family transcriptional regulator [Pseudoalteromonas luteoviolacea]KZN52700.1 hypothetical protein N476_09715 [Pseudoalteromonas luteoviolacea H33]KZN73830.1 hypothetical protein N477_22690 [Pseudoalteromonas luteoviolacea H33-S]